MKGCKYDFLKIDARNKSVLDVGCGSTNEFVIHHFKELKYGVGIDPRHNPPHSIISDAENLPFKNNFFDIVICAKTLTYVKNPIKVLKEIFRVSKPNATIIFELQLFGVYLKYIVRCFRFDYLDLLLINSFLSMLLKRNVLNPSDFFQPLWYFRKLVKNKFKILKIIPTGKSMGFNLDTFVICKKIR